MKVASKEIFDSVFRIVITLLILMTVCQQDLHAKDVPSSTFVGNGGDVQDLDLSVSLAVIKTIVGDKDIRNSQTLCTCGDDWQENDICKILRQLSPAEVNACRQIITERRAELASLAARSSPVDFSWSENSMMVQAQAQKARPVDAVTQRDKNKIIINRSRFYAMPPSYRVALVTHELFHLIKINDAYTTDEQAAPPFSSGRAMLNALGAAIAMEANEKKVFHEFKSLQEVSRSQKKHWLALNWGDVRHPARIAGPLLKTRRVSHSFTLGYSYRKADFGLDLVAESLRYDGSTSSIDVSEKIAIYHIAPHYRINPINYYLSRWNELYFTFGLDLGVGTANYSARSAKVEKKDKSDVMSFGGAARVFIPVVNGMWITTGFEYRQLRYEYKKLHNKTIENQSLVTIGGACGF